MKRKRTPAVRVDDYAGEGRVLGQCIHSWVLGAFGGETCVDCGSTCTRGDDGLIAEYEYPTPPAPPRPERRS